MSIPGFERFSGFIVGNDGVDSGSYFVHLFVIGFAECFNPDIVKACSGCVLDFVDDAVSNAYGDVGPSVFDEVFVSDST